MTIQVTGPEPLPEHLATEALREYVPRSEGNLLFALVNSVRSTPELSEPIKGARDNVEALFKVLGDEYETLKERFCEKYKKNEVEDIFKAIYHLKLDEIQLFILLSALILKTIEHYGFAHLSTISPETMMVLTSLMWKTAGPVQDFFDKLCGSK